MRTWREYGFDVSQEPNDLPPMAIDFPHDYFFSHPNQLLRLGFAIDRRLPRNRRPHSKYNITERIQKYLKGTGC